MTPGRSAVVLLSAWIGSWSLLTVPVAALLDRLGLPWWATASGAAGLMLVFLVGIKTWAALAWSGPKEIAADAKRKREGR